MRKRLLCEQRGAISILAALSLVFVIASAAMTVDIGQAAWQKRSLQKVVDVVSLDAVRAVGDRRNPLLDHYVQTLDLAQKSATRNSFDYADTAHGNSLTVELGVADAVTKAFTPVASGQYGMANAVRVTATHRNDNRFIPGSIPVTTQAVSMIENEATFSIGSRLASFNSTTSPILSSVLGGMLGSAVSLDAVSYNGLAGGSVRLGDVWANLGLGTSSQVLDTEVGYENFLNATAQALNNQGDPASVNAASVLGTLATQINTTKTFKFGDLLALATSGDTGDAANAQINVLEMIGMAATVANGTNLLNFSLPLTIPGVTSTSFKMSVIEPPVIASGPARQDGSGNWVTQAHTAQVRMQMDMTLLQKLTVLLQQGTVHLPVYLEAAGATGALTAVQCAEPETDSTINVHTTTQAVTAKVGVASDASLQNPGIPAEVLPAEIVNILGLVRVTGSAVATLPTSATDLLIPLFQYRSAGGSSVALDDNLLSSLALTVQALGLGVNVTQVTNNTLAILSPVLNALDNTLFNVLKAALGPLGIEIGGADVGNLDTFCSARRLIG